jgi:SAM-dependent methyltransferase
MEMILELVALRHGKSHFEQALNMRFQYPWAMKLNLGCGYNIRQGWLNLDRNATPGVDVVCNLDSENLPFDTNTFSVVLASHVLEHVDDLNRVMKEIYRVLKPGGKAVIVFPYYTHPNAWFGFDHKRCLTAEMFRKFYHEGQNDYHDDTPKFRGFEYSYVPTWLGYMVYPFIKVLRHFCNILILEVRVVLTK